MEQTIPACLYCGRNSDAIPLIAIQYRSDTQWICPQHLPILIHKPEQLVAFLPGLENVTPADHNDHDHHQ
ncbi:MAG: hypothetical protein JSV61_15445 [Anaerolineales bacterium]|nr:MAG: hypothetical protein JSV61_15445 [Anaerolineales bacterium]